MVVSGLGDFLMGGGEVEKKKSHLYLESIREAFSDGTGCMGKIEEPKQELVVDLDRLAHLKELAKDLSPKNAIAEVFKKHKIKPI